MKTWKLDDLLEQQRVLERTCQYESSKSRDLEFRGGTLTAGGKDYRLNEQQRIDVALLFGIKKIAFQNLDDGQQQALIEYGRRRNADLHLILVMKDDSLLSIRPADEVSFKPSQILEAVRASVPNDVDLDCFPGKYESLSPCNLNCSIIANCVQEEVREGDIVCAGLEIIYPVYNSVLPDVSRRIERLVCRNGMRATEYKNPLRDLYKQLAEYSYPEVIILRELTHCFRRAWDESRILLRGVSSLQEQPVQDPVGALGNMARRMRLDRNASRRLLQSYYEDELGENPTRFGILNAVTRLMTHGGVSPGNRQRLESIAQRLLQAGSNQCPACLSFFRNEN